MPFYYSQGVLRIFKDYHRQYNELLNFVTSQEFIAKTNQQYQESVLSHLNHNCKLLKEACTVKLSKALEAWTDLGAAKDFAENLKFLATIEFPAHIYQDKCFNSSKLEFKWYQLKKNLLDNIISLPAITALETKEIKKQNLHIKEIISQSSFLLSQNKIGEQKYPDGLPLNGAEETLLNMAIEYAKSKKNNRISQNDTLKELAIEISQNLVKEIEKQKKILEMLKILFSYISLDGYTLDVIEDITKLIPGVAAISKNIIPEKIRKKTDKFIHTKMLATTAELDEKKIDKFPRNTLYLKKTVDNQGEKHTAYWLDNYLDQESKKCKQRVAQKDLLSFELMDLELPEVEQSSSDIGLIRKLGMRYKIVGDELELSFAKCILTYILNDDRYKTLYSQFKESTLTNIQIRANLLYHALNKQPVDQEYLDERYQKSLQTLQEIEKIDSEDMENDCHTVISQILNDLSIQDPFNQEYYENNLYYSDRYGHHYPLNPYSKYKKSLKILIAIAQDKYPNICKNPQRALQLISPTVISSSVTSSIVNLSDLSSPISSSTASLSDKDDFPSETKMTDERIESKESESPKEFPSFESVTTIKDSQIERSYIILDEKKSEDIERPALTGYQSIDSDEEPVAEDILHDKPEIIQPDLIPTDLSALSDEKISQIRPDNFLDQKEISLVVPYKVYYEKLHALITAKYTKQDEIKKNYDSDLLALTMFKYDIDKFKKDKIWLSLKDKTYLINNAYDIKTKNKEIGINLGKAFANHIGNGIFIVNIHGNYLKKIVDKQIKKSASLFKKDIAEIEKETATQIYILDQQQVDFESFKYSIDKFKKNIIKYRESHYKHLIELDTKVNQAQSNDAYQNYSLSSLRDFLINLRNEQDYFPRIFENIKKYEQELPDQKEYLLLNEFFQKNKLDNHFIAAQQFILSSLDPEPYYTLLVKVQVGFKNYKDNINKNILYLENLIKEKEFKEFNEQIAVLKNEFNKHQNNQSKIEWLNIFYNKWLSKIKFFHTLVTSMNTSELLDYKDNLQLIKKNLETDNIFINKLQNEIKELEKKCYNLIQQYKLSEIDTIQSTIENLKYLQQSIYKYAQEIKEIQEKNILLYESINIDLIEIELRSTYLKQQELQKQKELKKNEQLKNFNYEISLLKHRLELLLSDLKDFENFDHEINYNIEQISKICNENIVDSMNIKSLQIFKNLLEIKNFSDKKNELRQKISEIKKINEDYNQLIQRTNISDTSNLKNHIDLIFNQIQMINKNMNIFSKKVSEILPKINQRIDLLNKQKQLARAKKSIKSVIDNYKSTLSCVNVYGHKRADELNLKVNNSKDMDSLNIIITNFIITGKMAIDKHWFSFFRSPTRSSSIGRDSLQGRLIDHFFENYKLSKDWLRITYIKQMLQEDKQEILTKISNKLS